VRIIQRKEKMVNQIHRNIFYHCKAIHFIKTIDQTLATDNTQETGKPPSAKPVAVTPPLCLWPDLSDISVLRDDRGTELL
jgi:hypothetical protein